MSAVSSSTKYIILTLLTAMCLAGAANAADTFKPPPKLLDTATCFVSKIPLKNFRKWNVVQVDRDGMTRTFVSMKNFLEYVNHPDKYTGEFVRHGGDVWVTDNQTGKWVPGLFAWYVAGEQVIGPNGKDIAAFESKTDAEKYWKRTGAIIFTRMLGLKRSVLDYVNGVKPDTASEQPIVPTTKSLNKPPVDQ